MSAIVTGQLLLADSGWGWDHMNGGGWVLMGIGMILFWGLLILGIVWLVRTLTEHRGPVAQQGHQPGALEILDRKLAEGTVSVEEYQERRRLLTGEGGKT